MVKHTEKIINTIVSFSLPIYLCRDATHRRSVYEETGQFIVGNNAITGVKVSKSGDIFVTGTHYTHYTPYTLPLYALYTLSPLYTLYIL